MGMGESKITFPLNFFFSRQVICKYNRVVARTKKEKKRNVKKTSRKRDDVFYCLLQNFNRCSCIILINNGENDGRTRVFFFCCALSVLGNDGDVETHSRLSRPGSVKCVYVIKRLSSLSATCTQTGSVKFFINSSLEVSKTCSTVAFVNLRPRRQSLKQ